MFEIRKIKKKIETIRTSLTDLNRYLTKYPNQKVYNNVEIYQKHLHIVLKRLNYLIKLIYSEYQGEINLPLSPYECISLIRKDLDYIIKLCKSRKESMINLHKDIEDILTICNSEINKAILQYLKDTR